MNAVSSEIPACWEIAIRTEAGAWSEADTQTVQQFAAAALAIGIEETDAVEVSIVLADNAFVQDLNKTYRGKDAPTNVLSFEAEAEPMPGEPEILGDVILAQETCAREAAETETPFEHHLAHLAVHGVLHLLGYDHIEPSDADEMEALEIEILAKFGIENPYAGSDPILVHETPDPVAAA